MEEKQVPCLNCGKLITPNTGRRPKKFCSDNCRASFSAKNRNKNTVHISTYDRAVEENRVLLAENLKLKTQIQDLTKPNEEVKSVTETPSASNIPALVTATQIETIQEKIEKLQQAANSCGTSGLGEKTKKKYLEEIEHLKSLL